MATISGNLYRIKYTIVTNSANTDPPAIVPVFTEALVFGATDKAAVAALLANLGISGSQRLKIFSATEVDSHIVVQQ
jgi:hypothetical protein